LATFETALMIVSIVSKLVFSLPPQVEAEAPVSGFVRL